MLISDADPEQRLQSFLRGYKRVPNQQICQIALTQMPHVWVYMPDGWQKITPRTTQVPRHMSWCQWALSSALGLDRAGYERAKKELFGRSISGVYHRPPDEYAIVYRPARAAVGGRESQGSLTASEWAAVAGGSVGLLALGGLGVSKYRNRNKSGETLVPGPTVDGYSIKNN